MSTVVLGALAIFFMGGAAVAIRRQQTSWRTVEKHHRALDTMGKLAAQQAGPPHAQKSTDPQHPYVRVMRADAEPATPPKPPTLRSRPRRSRPAVPPRDPPEPGPNTRIVRAGQDWPGPVSTPAVPVDRQMLHFDANSDGPAPARQDSTWADIPPSQPSRSGWRRRRWPRIPVPRRAARMSALAATVVVLVAAGITAGLMAAEAGTHGRPSAPPHRTAASRPAPRPAPTTVPVAAPAATAAVLVTSSAGSSTYRVDGSATISIQATGPCWVQIRQDGPSGQVLFQGDMGAGDTHVAPTSGWVRLGNPLHVTVTVNGYALVPPSLVAGEPYNLEFV